MKLVLAYDVIGGVGGSPAASGFTSTLDGGIWSGVVPVTSLMVLTDELSTVMAAEVEPLSSFGELPD